MDHYTARHYSVSETCFFLGISRSQLYKLIAVGDIRPVKIGSRTLFSSREIDRFSNSLMGLPINTHNSVRSGLDSSSSNII